ncbi:MAG: TonB-dependent receptor [Dysgonamonadaceae bacterium]|jgi:outer membrane cobalamin receptor|nr:TonB-dependent receptor [Dysgonamonadaceae bacterium]
MQRIVLTLWGLLALFISALAQNYTISGSVTDAKTGETLISSSVFDVNSKKGVAANLYGFYSLTLSGGQVQIQYSYVGYAPHTVHFNLSKDTVINVRLEESALLQEVVVVGNRQELGVQGSQMSAISVPIAQIKAIPTIFGENDLIKALQLLPGVQAGAEGFTGFYVRGGGPDENLFLLDGVPIYNINHLGGFFSVFNSDAVKNVTLYKGGFPARFGSRLSSVLDVRMNDGNNKKLHGNFSIGLIASKINLEGPLFNENTTFNISARRTYFDILAKPFIRTSASSEDMERVDAGYYFYDLNAKINHKLSDKDRLYLSFYMGDDVVYAATKNKNQYFEKEENGMPQEITTNDQLKLNWNWGNLLTVLRWNRILTNKLFMNTTATYTRYRSSLGVGQSYNSTSPNDPDYDVNLTYKSGIEDFSGKIDWDYAPNPNHDVKLGIDYIHHTFRPSVYAAKMNEDNRTPIDTVVGDKNIASHEMAVYLEDNISLGRFVKANAGLRYSTFFVQDKFYQSLQPRLSIRALINRDLSFKAAYSCMSQYIHLLSNNTISLPTDLWVPVTRRIVPMESSQWSAGVFYNLNQWVELSLESYYKTMDNLIEYKDGATFLTAGTGWEDKVSAGKGWAYGVEFLAQKTVGKTTGWIGYTWSKTERLFDRPGEELNFGKVFPAKYDRRHDFNIVVTHKFSDRIDVSATWVYSTGNCATLGLQEYSGVEIPKHNTSGRGDESGLTYISQRNNYRNPDYQRLDLGVNFHKRKKYGIRTWSIGVYNVYNRMNPFFVYPQDKGYYDENDQYKRSKVLKQVTIFPIIPSISYSYSF